MFVSGGLDAIRHPESEVERAEAVTQTLSNQVPGLPKDTVTLIAEVAASGAARRGVNLAVPYVRHANESALGAAKTAVDVAGPFLTAGVERAGEVLT